MQEDTPNAMIIALAVTVALLVVVMILLLVGIGLPLLLTPAADFSETDTIAEAVPTAEPTPIVTARAAPPDPARYTWTPIVSDLDNPLLVTHAGDGSNRLFAVEQAGYVLVIENGQLLPTPFLDVSLLLSDDVFQGGYTERGLLGLAFHPNYEQNGLFFIHHTDTNGDSIVARYEVSRFNANRANPDTRRELLKVEQPFYDHNGGGLAFGPDGYLYISLGDGGNPNLPNTNSQDPGALLGKLLRIDVDHEGDKPYAIPESNPFVNDPAYAPEIWALGLRNPWRFSFDRATGDLYIADVGQWKWEEVNFQPGDSPGGQNYGWSAYEGTHRYLDFDPPEELISPMTEPIIEYPHEMGCSVTGGHVYRGANLPELHGVYFYGDYCNGMVWGAYRDLTGAWQTITFQDTDFVITSFGEDEQGELYTIDFKGVIYRLDAAS
jgi:glucose/arabinose dehydrogenase